jgi:membrane-associated phospholipid phosphatase
MKMRTPALCLSITLCSCLAAPQWAVAQSVATESTAPAHAVSHLTPAFPNLVEEVIGDFRRLPSKENASLLGIGAAVAMMGHSIDQSLSLGMSRRPTLGSALEPGNIIGGFQAQFGGALATYAVGRLMNSPRTATVGADLVRALVVSQTVTGTIKVIASRTRPDGTNLSFPSGHTSASFASAAVLQRHFGWKVGAPAMGIAAYVAAARIQEKRHFLSDVAFGATIGLAAGRTVTIGHGRGRFAVAPAAAPGGAGVAFTWVGQ